MRSERFSKLAANDIVQIKLTTTVLGKDVFNIFHYIQGAGGTIPGDLAEVVNAAFWASIDTQLLACLHPSVTVKSSELVYLTFLSAWNILPIGEEGTWNDVTEQGAAPRQVTIGFRYQRTAVGQRNGYKRFSGGSIDALEDGVWGAAMAVTAGDLADALEDGFTAGTTPFYPYVAKRPITLGVNPPGYVSDAVSFYQGSSQNSRK